MYCVSCGKLIQKESKFCSNCGVLQGGEINWIKQFVNRISSRGKEVISEKFSDQDSVFERLIKKASGWYIAWILLNLGVLLIVADSIFSEGKRSRFFWPIDKYSHLADYDIREFIVYTIFPIAILYTWNRIDPDFKATSRVLKRRRKI